MAFQSGTRDPLLDSQMQQVIQRRGTELIGFAQIALGVVLTLMLWSYSPNDAGWMSATNAPSTNAFGAFGALISSRLILTIGLAAWALPVLAFAWGLRFVLHIGDDRLLSRAVLIPIFVAAAAIFLACQTPGAGWPHGFSLGGLSGDAILGIFMDLMPFGTWADLMLLTFLFTGIFAATALFSLGFTWDELYQVRRFVLISIILTYDSILALTGFIFRTGHAGAGSLGQNLAALRKTPAAPMPQSEFPQATAPEPAPQSSPGVFRMPKLMRVAEAPVQEEVTDDLPPHPVHDGLDPEDRVKARISNAVQAKVLRARDMRNREMAEETLADALELEPNTAPPLGGASRDFDDPQPMDEDDFDAAMDDELFEEPELDTTPDAPAVNFSSVRKPTPEPTPSVVQHQVKKPIKQSAKAKAEAQPSLFQDKSDMSYETPPLSLLANPTSIIRHHLSDEALAENARMLETVLDDYGVKGEIVSVRPGPVVTMYELEPAPGLKASRVIGLADDIARSMSALSARVSTVPGRSVIGIELPNENRETVLLREILSSADYGDGDHRLPLALGKDIGGQAVVANLAKMPHLLIAGTTGSGKSVAINTMILSLLYKLSPDECRLIMIDPKMLELSVYDGIPHLLSPVVTDPKKAVVALKWVVGEMEERYRKMSKMGVRNILGYNAKVQAALDKGKDFERTVQTGFDDETGDPVFETESFTPEKMPYIVVVVDEMADLMMVAGKEIEACIQRLAQMARASGIHLIMATQRPSVDVITGTIKANFPTRISFQVTSKVDSRTILGEMGAEQLLGMGDMLYMAGGGKITRIHAPFASDEEVEEVVNALKAYGPPEYVSGVADGPSEEKSEGIDAVLGLGGNTTGEDALYDQAVAIVIRDRKCSTSYIQRKLAIGYNKAARLVEQMEDQGVVSAANPVGKRDILVPEQ